MNNLKPIMEFIKLKKDLLIRILVQIISIVAMTGCISVNENKAYIIITAIFNVIVTAYNVYMNFSVSKEATTADKLLHAMKDENITLEQVDDFLTRVKNHTYFETYGEMGAGEIDYKSNLGKRLADFNNKAYNSFQKNGIPGQCVWYVRGRAYEKLGADTKITGNANTWFSQAVTKGLRTSKTLESDSIVCLNRGKYGHVIYIECVDGNTVYYTEANANGGNKISADDGILKKCTVAAMVGGAGYQGCICLTEKKVEEFKAGQTYTLITNVKVRTGAGTNCKQKKVTELTADGQKNCVSKSKNDLAILKSGTRITLQELKILSANEVWARIPSGWIAVKYGGKNYIK